MVVGKRAAGQGGETGQFGERQIHPERAGGASEVLHPA
jgi:hypothetical protein